MNFLEYDLNATATLEFDNGVMNLNGKCNFIHSDVNVDWQHVFTQNMRWHHSIHVFSIIRLPWTISSAKVSITATWKIVQSVFD
ncbi:unnamed protein product [Merluccius merluccius]